jgi:bacillolysin
VNRLDRFAAPLAAVLVLLVASPRVEGQIPSRGVRIAEGTSAFAPGVRDAAALAELRQWDLQVTTLARSGDLQRVSTDTDALVPGRIHERYVERYHGVRVFGADVRRQLNGFGQAESVFGTFYPDIATSVTPQIGDAQARELLGAAGHGTVGTRSRFELVILPLEDGSDRLSWTARVRSTADGLVRRVFVDAASGRTLLSYNDTWTQGVVGRGTDVLGTPRKVLTELIGGQYLAIDVFRPSGPALGLPAGNSIVFDMHGDVVHYLTALLPSQSDIARDTDNVWTDPGIVAAQFNTGLTYDYYYTRFHRQGIDNHNLQIWTFTNPVRPQDYPTYYKTFASLFLDAAYLGDGEVYYGVGLPPGVTAGGETWVNVAAGLDVVAHELTHGVTDYTSHLIYLNESGALNEAFSDMMGAAVENYWQTPGPGLGQADWLIGEDVARPDGLRSLADPHAFGDPDHYSLRYTGTLDNGGVHTNSCIVSHMFYLAIMGGTNRVSGLSVTGVGYDHRDQIVDAIYRAFTELMPADATFSTARAATIQSARDLYGAGSPPEQALIEAWTAVGVS